MGELDLTEFFERTIFIGFPSAHFSLYDNHDDPDGIFLLLNVLYNSLLGRISSLALRIFSTRSEYNVIRHRPFYNVSQRYKTHY